MKIPVFAGASASLKRPEPTVPPLSMARLSMFVLLALAVAVGVRAEEDTVDVNTADVNTADVNTADVNDAQTIARVLVGVGQTKAEAIVAYREENGRFEDLEDLARVRGIGEATLKRNESRISLGDEED